MIIIVNFHMLSLLRYSINLNVNFESSNAIYFHVYSLHCHQRIRTQITFNFVNFSKNSIFQDGLFIIRDWYFNGNSKYFNNLTSSINKNERGEQIINAKMFQKVTVLKSYVAIKSIFINLDKTIIENLNISDGLYN
jgi:hypothetical protein